MKKIKLTNKELDVMMVFWESTKPLGATDIPKVNPEINGNTAQAVVKKLLKKEYIRVADIIYHGTVLTRAYEAVLTHEDYIFSQLDSGILSSHNLISALVKRENNPEQLKDLERLIAEQKELLKKGGDDF